MINKIIKKKGWLIKILVLLLSLAFVGPALADSYNAYPSTGQYVYGTDFNGTTGTRASVGWVLQIIYASSGSIHEPNADGSPGGGDVLIDSTSRTIGNIGGAGYFYYPLNDLTNGSTIYIRVWNSNSLASATHYGNSTTKAINNPPPGTPQAWTINSFGTTTPKPTPSITVTAPNGGGFLRGGQTTNVTWTSSNYTGNVNVQYSTDGGTSYPNAIATNISNSGSRSWTVPAGLNSSQVRVRVQSTDGSVSDTSNSNFTVDSGLPSVSISAPTTGATLTVNQPFTISWTASDPAVSGVTSGLTATPITIQYSTNGTTWTDIATSIANSGSRSWTPTATTTSGRIRITAVDNAGNSGQTTTGNFTVQDPPDTTSPTITSVSPSGTTVAIGQSVSITFSEPMAPASVSISSVSNPVAPDPGWSSGTWSNGNRTVSYNHTNFAYATTYTITVANTATDVAGNIITTPLPLSFSFTTANPPGITITSEWSNGDLYSEAEGEWRPDGSLRHDFDEPSNLTNLGFVYGVVNLLSASGEFGGTGGANSPNSATYFVEVRPAGAVTWSPAQDTGAGDDDIVYWEQNKIQLLINPEIDGNNYLAGQYEIKVSANGRESNIITVDLRPRLYGLGVNTGNPDTEFQIQGLAFGSDTQVLFGANPAPSVTVNAPNLLTVRVPNLPAGSYPVTVRSGGQTSSSYYILDDIDYNSDGVIDAIDPNLFEEYDATNYLIRFTVTDAPNPRVTSLTPTGGEQGASLDVTITGADVNWTDAAPVDFGAGITVDNVDAQTTSRLVVTITIAGDADTTTRTVTVNGLTSPDDFTVTAAGQPALENIIPPSADQGATNLPVSITARNTTWAGNMAASVHFSNADIVIVDATAADATHINLHINIPADAAFGPGTVTVTGATGTLNFRVNEVGGDEPTIGNLSTNNASIGQTIVITGTNFGANIGASSVTIGGVATVPTAWSDTSITLAIPQGVAAGAQPVVVTTADGAANTNITISTDSIYIDDFEGGSVGSFAGNGLIDSGYYVFANVSDITPTNANINDTTNGIRQAAAAQAGSFGGRVRYSYVGTDGSDWGGGWGGLLANTLDLSDVDTITFYIKWDGSANEFKLSLQDEDGTATSVLIPNTGLILANNYAQFTVNQGIFAYDEGGSAAGSNADFDWTKVNKYNLVYTTTNTSANYHQIDTIVAHVAEVGQPALVSIAPDNADQGAADLAVTLTARNTNWTVDSNMSAVVHFSNTDIVVNSATAQSATTILLNITIPADAAAGQGTVTVDNVSGSVNFTVNGPGGGDDPVINNLSATDAEIGQTVIINGSNFGDMIDGGLVRFGESATTNPTFWSDTKILVAVPQDAPTGESTVTVVNDAGLSGSTDITISNTVIYLDDFEGGSVGSFAGNGLVDSGYYVFENVEDITPTDADINKTDEGIRQAEALHDENYGAKVKYSYVGTDGSDWGGGWGGLMSNTYDLTNAESITLNVKWDGSGNDFKLSLSDEDGTAVSALVSNDTLARLGATYGEIQLNVGTNFTYDAEGSAATADATFDWTKVVSYNLVYNSTETSTGYHYLDNVIAHLADSGPVDPDAVFIDTVTPAAAPAGTNITITGQNFGLSQGNSTLYFYNTSTGASYPVTKIYSWTDTVVEAQVPRLAEAGNYILKITKIAISAAGEISAQESNPEDFTITANAAAAGSALIFPNPFNPIAERTGQANAAEIKAATIAYDAGTATRIGIYIYDMTAKLVYHEVTTGSQISWDGYDQYTNLVGDGAYILRVIDEDSKKLIAKDKILVIKY
ncbi:MAG: IPT/TIG domain-containing protein [bacterium]